MTSFSR